MFQLKNYQQVTLDKLMEYLDLARISGPTSAFQELVSKSIYRPLLKLEDAPYVCLRLPTGGGKTLLATHSISVAAKSFLECDYPIVLWLVPTNTIKIQTLETLQNPSHPNRQVLDQEFDGRVLVVDITDFTQIRPQDLKEKVCIVVGTIATPRVNSTEIRKVYAHHEDLESHFTRVTNHNPWLEKFEDGPNKGQIKFSFANLLALIRPLVIIDEAHNASSNLSVEVLQRLHPSCIIEFTATPASNSNILHHVSAAELKAAEMIKLPIILTEHPTWQEAVHDSILTRERLQQFAINDPQYIHPIVLFQAEDKGREVTYEVIKDYLITQEKIPVEKIAIATGNQRELDGVNLLDPSNKIEYIITVEALKEGWDCPFAYTFCSVATVHSKKDVEQLLGRVLRMPYVERRSQEELNRAYAHVSSTSWPKAIDQLQDRLVGMGFEEQEARAFISPQNTLPTLFDTPYEPPPETSINLFVSESPLIHYFTPQEQKQITVISTDDGKLKLEIKGEISQDFEKRLLESVPEIDRKPLQQTIAVKREQAAQASRIKVPQIEVPQLCLMVDGSLELAEHEWFLDRGGWKISDFPAVLTPGEFTIDDKAESFSIDLKGKQLAIRYLGSQSALDFEGVDTNWTDLYLSRWIGNKLYQNDVRQEDMIEFTRKLVNHLITQRNIPLEKLVRARFLLEKVTREKIKEYRAKAYNAGYQARMFDNKSAVETSYQYAFKFDPENYPASEYYQGRYVFQKHFNNPPLIGAFDSDPEFECAKILDQNENIKRWVRNLVDPKFGFRLPLSTGFFYPDLIAELGDGRILIVEFKGEIYIGSSQEKKNIGELWEERSNGKGLFLFAVEQDDKGRGVYRQLLDKLKYVYN
jgi:type III restriction enzyme